jgi:predicted  nucleic acid-binding Zn-ribbon protein
MDEIIQRTTVIENQIKGLKSFNARRDLGKMLKVLERSITELSQESVECRRLHKSTTKYQTLESKCAEQLDNLEKHLTYARLLYG